MDIGELSVDTESAVNAIEKLTDAVERLEAALKKLGGAPHGGIRMEIAGDVALISVAPATTDGNYTSSNFGISRS
jgi:hypothetical protein